MLVLKLNKFFKLYNQLNHYHFEFNLNYLTVAMKKTQSSYKNLYTAHSKVHSRPKLSASNSALKLNTPQYLSNKENDSRALNRPVLEPSYQSLQPRLRREFKLYTEIQEDDKSSLRSKIQILEEKFQNKIIDEGFMKFFKTANSSSNMSHIDIYLEMIKFEEAVVQKNKYIKQLEQRLNDSNKQIQKLLVVKEDSQKMEAKHIKEMNLFSEIVDKLKAASQEARQYKQKHDQIKALCDEVNKKRIDHLKRIKQLEQKGGQKEDSLDYQQLQSLRDQVEKYSLRCDQFQQQNLELVKDNLKIKQALQRESRKVDQHLQQINSLKEQLWKKDQLYKEAKSKCTTIQEIYKSQQASVLQKQSQAKQSLSKIQQFCEKVSALQIQRDYYKCMVAKHEDEIQQHKNNLSKMSSSLQIQQSNKKDNIHQIDNLKREKTQLNGVITSLKEEIDLLIKDNQQLQKQKLELNGQLKQSTLNQKKLSTEKYRFILRLQKQISELQHFNISSSHSNSTECNDHQKVLNDFASIISSVKNRIYELQTKANSLQLDKYSKNRNQSQNIDLREQTIKLLLKFVPLKCSKLVEEYLIVTEEYLMNSEVHNMTKRMMLIQKIQKEAFSLKESLKEEIQSQKIKVRESDYRSRQVQRQKEIQRQKSKDRQITTQDRMLRRSIKFESTEKSFLESKLRQNSSKREKLKKYFD